MLDVDDDVCIVQQDPAAAGAAFAADRAAGPDLMSSSSMPSTMALTWRSLGAEAIRKTSASASRSLTSRATMSWAILSAAARAAYRAVVMDDSDAVTGLLVMVIKRRWSVTGPESARQAADDHDDAGDKGDYAQREDAKLKQPEPVGPAEPGSDCVQRLQPIGRLRGHGRQGSDVFAGLLGPFGILPGAGRRRRRAERPPLLPPGL